MSRVIRGSSRFKEYERIRVEERFDYADLVRRQIERCLMLSYDMNLFMGAVQALESLIPDELKDSIYKDEFDEASIDEERFEWEYGGPLPLGTIEEPVMKDNPQTGIEYPVPYIEDVDKNRVIDWSSPHILSPRLVKREQTNWYSRFYAAFNMFVRLGIAIRRVNRT